MTLIPLPSGWSSTGAAVNDLNQVAGIAYGVVPNGQAFIGTASASTIIPLPPGATYAEVQGECLNNSGVVVGQSDAGGWMWSASAGTQLLNALVPPGWTISNGVSISQNGRILAQGSLNGGASQFGELIPVGLPTTPAPRSGFLVIAGLLLVFGWRFRDRLLA